MNIPPDMNITSKRPTVTYVGADGSPKQAGGTSLDPRRVIGLGKDLDKLVHEKRIGLGADLKAGVGAAEMVQPIIDGLGCDISKIPVIHQSRWNFNGPLNDAAVTSLFGAQCDIFGAGKAPAGVQAVQSTMPINGELQTYAVLCGVFYHVEPEPISFVVPGNAWSVGGTAMPAAGAIGVVSPDTFTQIDIKAATAAATTLAAAAGNVLGLAATDTLVPALLNWGRWANYAAWHLVRAYNFLWQWGLHTTLANIPLRHIAWMPTNAERGSTGQIDVEIAPYARRVNSTNRSNSPVGTASFVPRNARRTGSMSINAVAGTSLFTPDTSFDRASAVYGGMGLRELLRGNSEFFRLPAPYGVRPGVALGMLLNASDNVELGLMQNELSITQGLGLGSSPVATIPPVINFDNNVTGNGGWSAATIASLIGMVELSRDVIAAQNVLQTIVSRALFKGGSYFQTVGMLGYELTERQWRQIQDMAGAQEALDLACGCQLVS